MYIIIFIFLEMSIPKINFFLLPMKFSCRSHLKFRELSNMHMFEEFDESAWFALVDHMTAYSKEDVRVIFKDGSEIKA